MQGRQLAAVLERRSRDAVERLLRRELAGVPLRVPALALIVAVVMLPVALFLAALGVLVLNLSGGAAADTGLVVMVAAVAVTDFWGGSVMRALTQRSERDVMVSWLAARAVLLVLVAVLVHRLLPLVPVQLALAAPAAWLGARLAAKQAALRAAARSPQRPLADLQSL